MTRSIRWPFRIFNRLKHQKTFVEGISQSNGANLGASQIGDNFYMANAGAIYANAGASSCQANVYQSYQMSEGRNDFKYYNGATSGLNRQQIGTYANAGIVGTFAQDGSPRFFKWDAALGCMARTRLSIPFMRRLSFACRAFVNAWRLA